jgi:hypothetical protein
VSGTFVHVSTAYELGWGALDNGALLQLAEKRGFEILITTDQNLKYQQNLVNRKIAIVVLSTTSWPRIQKSLSAIVKAVDSIQENGCVEITISQGS